MPFLTEALRVNGSGAEGLRWEKELNKKLSITQLSFAHHEIQYQLNPEHSPILHALVFRSYGSSVFEANGFGLPVSLFSSGAIKSPLWQSPDLIKSPIG